MDQHEGAARRLKRRTWMTAGLVALATLAAQPAAASVDSTVAAGPDGSAAFAWAQAAAGVQIHERAMAADGSLSDAQPLSYAFRTGSAQSIGADAGGNAVVTWVVADGTAQGVYARRRAADGSLSAIQRLTPAGSALAHPDAKLAVAPDGDAVVVWTLNTPPYRVVQARRRAADGLLGPIRTLSYTAGYSSHPDVAVTPGGAATVAWTRELVSQSTKYFQTRTMAPDGSLSPVQDLTAPSQLRERLQVTVSDAGSAVFSWGFDGSGFEVQSRTRTPGGTLGPTEVVASPGGSRLAVAGDGAGRTAYVWCACDARGPSRNLRGRIRHPNGTFSPVFEVFTGAPDLPIVPGVAMDPNGNVTFAWQAAGAESSLVWMRRRSAGGLMAPMRQMSDGTRIADDVHVAVDAAGKATVAWYQPYHQMRELFARTVTAGGTASPVRKINGPAF